MQEKDLRPCRQSETSPLATIMSRLSQYLLQTHHGSSLSYVLWEIERKRETVLPTESLQATCGGKKLETLKAPNTTSSIKISFQNYGTETPPPLPVPAYPLS